MNFLIETTDMDLGDTPIENIFINDYMPMANGTYVKVYLLGFKYAMDKENDMEVNNQVIAKHLSIPLEDVLNAWDFWEEKGIVEKIYNGDDKYNYGIKFLNLKQLYIKNNYNQLQSKPDKKRVVRPEDLIEANENVVINQMFKKINDLVRRQTTVNEKMEILSWIQDYNMNPDVIEFAFTYAVDKKGIKYNHIKYVASTIVNWYDRDLTNLEAIMEDFKKRDKRYYEYKRIMSNLGIYGSLTEAQKLRMDRWLDKYDLDYIIEVCNYASLRSSNVNFNYIESILQGWEKQGIKTMNEADLMDKEAKNTSVGQRGKSVEKRPSVKTKFHNFKQRTDDYTEEELEEVARRKREEFMKKLRGEL